MAESSSRSLLAGEEERARRFLDSCKALARSATAGIIRPKEIHQRARRGEDAEHERAEDEDEAQADLDVVEAFWLWLAQTTLYLTHLFPPLACPCASRRQHSIPTIQRRRRGVLLLPPSSGPTQVGATPSVAFRAKIGANGKPEVEIVL